MSGLKVGGEEENKQTKKQTNKLRYQTNKIMSGLKVGGGRRRSEVRKVNNGRTCQDLTKNVKEKRKRKRVLR